MSEGEAQSPSRQVHNLRLVPRRAEGPAGLEPIALKPGVMYVGRVDTNDVQLPSELVSRRHAKLIFTDMGLTIHDLDSHNGVFLNGKKVRSTAVEIGDYLYFADVCCQVEQSEGDETQDAFDVESSMNKSNLVNQVLHGEGGDDPAVRNLATLIQATDLLLSTDDDTFFPEIVSRCRDLTEATLGVLIKKQPTGLLETPVILREGTAPRGEAPVSWAVVRKAIDEGVVLFSKDTAADPLMPGELLASGDGGAVMCVPVMVSEKARAAIYLARPFGGEGFTDREVETVSAVAHLIGVRLGGGAAASEATSIRRVDVSTSEEPADENQTQLEQEADALRAKAKDLEAELAERERARSLAEQERARFEEERARLEEEVAALKEQVAAGPAAGGDADQQVAELEARLDGSHAELAAARNDSASAREELAKVRRENERATEEAQRAAGETGRLQEENERLQSQLEEQRAARERLESIQSEASEEKKRLDEERVRLSSELESQAEAHRAEVERLQQALAEAEQAAGGVALAALEKASRGLSPRVATRVAKLAQGETPDDELGAGILTALCLSLSGLDAWATTVSTDEAAARVESFCRAVTDAVEETGGTLEQIQGHAHLITFPGDAAGVSGALACATRTVEVVGEHEGTGVQGGIHLGPTVLGFFGGERGVYAQFGEAVAIARGACEYARPGTIFVTEKVRDVLGDDPSSVFIFAGPHLIRGFMSPFNLFQLGAPGGA